MQEQLLVNPAGIREQKFITTKNVIGALVSEPEAIHAGTIIFIPGWSGSREDFVATMPILSSLGWYCIAIDQHGQPASYGSNKEEDFTIENFAQDVIDIANSLSEPVHLVGHSFGGLVAQYGASKSPKSFASVTLMCSGTGPLPKENWGGLPALVQAVEKGRSLAFIWFVKTVTLIILRKQKFSKPVQKWRKQRWLNTNPLSLKVMSELLMNIENVTNKLKQTLENHKLPVLVLRGENDDAWPRSEQQEMALNLEANFVEIIGAAHSPARELPDKTAIELDTFLKSI
jgi:pimeloyl-ACP methyl ester carboxylesterase